MQDVMMLVGCFLSPKLEVLAKALSDAIRSNILQ